MYFVVEDGPLKGMILCAPDGSTMDGGPEPMCLQPFINDGATPPMADSALGAFTPACEKPGYYPSPFEDRK